MKNEQLLPGAWHAVDWPTTDGVKHTKRVCRNGVEWANGDGLRPQSNIRRLAITRAAKTYSAPCRMKNGKGTGPAVVPSFLQTKVFPTLTSSLETLMARSWSTSVFSRLQRTWTEPEPKFPQGLRYPLGVGSPR
jgi:hypothetical protein